ncbi:MAG: ECF transporter S component [Clostridia bacterium]|nr:ECF transporter S component [Clostridia bacterium]
MTANRTSRVRTLTTMGLLLGVMAIFTFTPLGFIQITPIVAVTLMHIPVLVGLLCEGFLPGLLLGFLFGALSLVRALTAPAGLLTPFFMNPLVSILPRLAVPCAAWLAYRGAAAALRGRKVRMAAAWTCSALAGTLTNTVGVLGMIYLLYAAPLAEDLAVASTGMRAFFGGIVLTNALPEAAFAALVVPALMSALFRMQRRTGP